MILKKDYSDLSPRINLWNLFLIFVIKGETIFVKPYDNRLIGFIYEDDVFVSLLLRR